MADADVYIPAFATGPNTSFMPSSTLDEKGYIKVDEFFQVKGLSGAFAASAW